MLKYSFRLSIIVFALILTGAQCISFGGGGAAEGAAGGVFKSVDRGDKWQPAVAIPTPSGVRTFGGANIFTLAIDPQDHLAIYAGTREHGMFYSYDGGDSWSQPKDVSSGFISSIAVDFENKCVIYVASGNRILKSRDCNRTFQSIHQESSAQIFVSALEVSPFNARMLFAGLTNGAIIKSVDGGASWALKANLSGRIIDLVPDPRNSSIIYAAVAGRGVWRSEDGGESFADLAEALKSIKDAKDVRRLVADRATPGAFLLASRNKLSRTTDGGSTWRALPIISPADIEILAAAVNPKNSREVYYATATTFYRSSDGGEQWSAEKLPTRRQSAYLLIDYATPTTLYLGVREVKK